MQCNSCNTELFSGYDIDDKTYCHGCYINLNLCSICNSLLNKDLFNNNPHVCDSCHSEYQTIKSDPRILNLDSETVHTRQVAETLCDFEALEHEALSSALYLKNFEILRLRPHAPFDEVRERCKELMQKWHPDLNKDNQEKYDQAIKKTSEIKQAYESILAEYEKPYLVLELKYGASQEDIMNAYLKLKIIYNLDYFYDNPALRNKVEQKRVEIKEALNILTNFDKQEDDTSEIKLQSQAIKQLPFINNASELQPDEINKNTPKTASKFDQNTSSLYRSSEPEGPNRILKTTTATICDKPLIIYLVIVFFIVFVGSALELFEVSDTKAWIIAAISVIAGISVGKFIVIIINRMSCHKRTKVITAWLTAVAILCVLLLIYFTIWYILSANPQHLSNNAILSATEQGKQVSVKSDVLKDVPVAPSPTIKPKLVLI